MKANIKVALVLLPASSSHLLIRSTHTTRSDHRYLGLFVKVQRTLVPFPRKTSVRPAPARISMLRGLNLITLVQCNLNVLAHVCRGRLVRYSDIAPSMITDMRLPKMLLSRYLLCTLGDHTEGQT